MKDAPRITLSWINDSHIMTYRLDKYNLALNSAWNKDLLHKELFRLKSMEFGICSLEFDSKEKANNTFGRHINHPV